MVGFRYFTIRNAGQLGVKGYVRNLASGDVEVVAQADERTMKEFINIIKKGPPSARITGVDIDYTDVQEIFDDFTVRY